jgi:PhnB protein
MQLHTYLNYGGNCEQAFHFYEQHLGGKITFLMRHGEQPGLSNVQADWQGMVLHARMNLGGTELLGADIPGYEPMRSAPMQETFFASRFAMLRDKFGTCWMLLHPKSRGAAAG